MMILHENILIDWMAFTLPYGDASMKNARSLAGPDISDDGVFGAFGYVSGYKILGSGRILLNPERHDMGIHVILPSSALALLDYRPLQLINLIRGWGGKFTRIDIAFDDFEGILDLDEMYEKLRQGHAQTRFRRLTRTEGSTIGQAEKMGYTVNVGSRKSQSFIRIYDKLLERRAKKCDVPAGVTHWIRVEMETKGEKANAIGKILGMAAEVGQVTAGAEVSSLLYGLLDFKDENLDDSNKSRWDTSEWWLQFVGKNAKRTLTLPKTEHTMDRSKKWINNTVAPTLAMIILSTCDDNGLSGWDFVVEQIILGEARMTNQQQKMLDDYNNQQKEKFIIV